MTFSRINLAPYFTFVKTNLSLPSTSKNSIPKTFTEIGERRVYWKQIGPLRHYCSVNTDSLNLLFLSSLLSFSAIIRQFERLFLRKIVAPVNTQSPLGFDATSFATIFWSFEWSKLEEWAFWTKGAQSSCLLKLMAFRSCPTTCFPCLFWLSIGNQNMVVLFIFYSNICSTKPRPRHWTRVAKVKNKLQNKIAPAMRLIRKTRIYFCIYADLTKQKHFS